MNKKGALNILRIKMTCPILRWRYFKLTDLTDFFKMQFYSPNIVHQASNVFMDLQAYAQDRFIYCK